MTEKVAGAPESSGMLWSTCPTGKLKATGHVTPERAASSIVYISGKLRSGR